MVMHVSEESSLIEIMTFSAFSLARRWTSKVCTLAVCICVAASSLQGADFSVQTPGGQFAFQINGQNTPTLTLIRGRTYTFDVATSPGFHPFHIQSPGCDTNDIAIGTIHFTVPMANSNC